MENMKWEEMTGFGTFWTFKIRTSTFIFHTKETS